MNPTPAERWRRGGSMQAVEIEIGGKPVEQELAKRLGEARVQFELGQPGLCELLFAGVGEREATVEIGAALTVRAGAEELFAGEVTAVEYVCEAGGELKLLVRGYDLLHRLRRRQTMRAYESLSVMELAVELAAAEGLEVECEVSLPTTRWIVQNRANDLALLQAHCRRSGVYPVVRGKGLQLVGMEGSGDAITVRHGEELLQARFEWNSESGAETVEARGWNPAESRAVAGEAKPEQAGEGTWRMWNRVAQDDGWAQRLAASEASRRGARRRIFQGVVEGRADLWPGRKLEVTGVPSMLEGTFVLTKVVHRIDMERGFVTEVGSTPPAEARETSGPGVVMGVVVDVSDPMEMGRVRVKYPAYQDVESDWLTVVVPGAGPKRGVQVLPSREDVVVVLMPEGDPAQAVVLGGVYRMDARPTGTVEGGERTRFQIQSAGHEGLLLDDGEKRVALRDGKGNQLEMTQAGMALHAEGDLTIAAPGRRIRIVADLIDFERG